jgi:4'-phosphopantetheinyl transferase EntD
MDMNLVLEAWREILPADVYLAAGPLLKRPKSLTSLERASAGIVDAERMLELECGREYAKRAMQMLGVHCQHLLIGADRAPAWPAGITGSLTHVRRGCNGHCAAAVARISNVCRLGIDAEYEAGLEPKTWPHFLSQKELQTILLLPVQARPLEAQIMWSAKEAVIKAAGRLIEPTAIEVERDSKRDRFMARLDCSLHGNFQSKETWLGRIARVQGLIIATIVVHCSKASNGARVSA